MKSPGRLSGQSPETPEKGGKANDKMKKCKDWVGAACVYDCPVANMEAYDDRYGYGLAEDLGYEKFNCNECWLNTGECKDCLFEDTEVCKVKGAATTNKRR